ncbi:MAG TPA: histidine--tRNA ligase [Solirubrobacteraceae bacterium]|nr:histidine--tRNA ligase [Solirubrobacteraceae bacterium]
MSASKIKAPRGTFDVLGHDAARRSALEARARAILEAAGYERIETPVFEATELFARGVGESTDIVRKEMFTFEDQAGRSLTLRPEGTAPVCRAYVEHGMHKRRQPVKLWYFSTFFRHERAQAGRYRQFWQVGAEAIGSEDPAVDAESIALLASLLADLGVRGLRLRLASLGSLDSRREYREQLQRHLRANAASLAPEVRERIDLNPLRAFDSEHPGTRQVMRSAPRLFDYLDAADAEHFAQVRALLDVAGVAYEIDHTLVRGLDYYTRTVFEFTSDALGAQSGVGGGGRYDGLVEQLGGPATPGMGWAAGIERMLLAGDGATAAATATGQAHLPASAPVELFVALEDGDLKLRALAFALLSEARSAGLSAQMDLGGRSLKGQLGHADALGARYVAILSDERTVLKDMQDGAQESLAANAIVHAVLRGHHAL